MAVALIVPIVAVLLWIFIPTPGDLAGATLVDQQPVAASGCGADRVTMAELAALTRAAGFEGEVAVATFWHESAGQVKARNPTSGAAGLAQIMPANVRALGGDPDVPEQNLRMAKQLADERVAAGRDPMSPWVSYTSGAYKKYLPEASKVASGDPSVSFTVDPCTIPVAQGPVDGTNGALEPATLCRVGVAPMAGTEALLQCSAAKALDRLAFAYRAETGKTLCYGNGYRTLAQQVKLARIKPGLAARAGTSNHGWGLAVDFCGGIERFGTPEHEWMVRRGPAFGWVHPEWARRGGSRPEAWHWEVTP